mmetsp:Transcript_32271/g.96357  ORF Transcript_32271/g.96357 Transcript_32271/m.96357 type:complete len:238 (+) Transcript_32271:906-1619(+)
MGSIDGNDAADESSIVVSVASVALLCCASSPPPLSDAPRAPPAAALLPPPDGKPGASPPAANAAGGCDAKMPTPAPPRAPGVVCGAPAVLPGRLAGVAARRISCRKSRWLVRYAVSPPGATSDSPSRSSMRLSVFFPARPPCTPRERFALPAAPGGGGVPSRTAEAYATAAAPGSKDGASLRCSASPAAAFLTAAAPLSSGTSLNGDPPTPGAARSNANGIGTPCMTYCRTASISFS